MQTLKEVLGRREERHNLQSAGLCILVVLVLVIFSFGLVHIKFMFESEQASGGEPVKVEARGEL